ncbi:group I truncated hemoglobin [Nitriliruptor alkaliphilus]|uniref:group I truncated hemoglobin n=1 Tax=Nitriliruptor alkaliphilus TaxID=427918 RepID=UPI000698E4A5|nr:group 1 truncated hemoglobin [Nitriliruptor alkaliphilus]
MATIFERYGGFTSIRKVVSGFYDRVLDDPQLGRHFVDVDMRGLINHQTQFISFVTGGPGTAYTDDALLRVHAPLHITAAELDLMRKLLRDTLEEHGFAPDDVDTIDRSIQARAGSIVNEP